MIITEISKRECCDWEDYLPLLGTEQQLKSENGGNFLNNNDMQFHYVICKHCWSVSEYYRYTDVAGDVDWNYRKVTK